MEIEIPDLDDLTFVTDCDACKFMDATDQAKCWRCDGKAKQLTPVGHRLMEFLQQIGIHVPNPTGWAK